MRSHRRGLINTSASIGLAAFVASEGLMPYHLRPEPPAPEPAEESRQVRRAAERAATKNKIKDAKRQERVTNAKKG